ncbi:MAG TPA: cell division protein FtsQ [Propionibacteriaceae bacterium]|nr:FtsQ-type POTRA domain-containing protein [Micropruina sp.]HBX80510.1 cell division protein FtsQ [Propionibacteriaceae bacterium]HBY23059.1 cell division protein FtsQ [Propionibacteriaceae bacterium]
MTGRVTDLTGTLDLRRRRRRVTLARRIALGVVAVALAVAMYWLVAISDVLAVRRVVVQGNALATEDAVVAAAAVPMGLPLVWVDTQAVGARVAQLPAVAQVTVRRDWPNTVTLQVTERSAALGVPQGSDAFTLVDVDGVAFSTVATLPEGVVPVTASLQNQRVLRDVATVLSSLPADLRAQVNAVTAPGPDEIVLTLPGVKVTWGSASDTTVKAQVTKALLATKATTIDVSSPSHPTTG